MSKAIKKFNALNGALVTREELQRIIDLAKKENNTEIIFRCSKALENFSDNEEKCLIHIKEYKSTGLNGAQHSGSYKEALDDCGRLKKGFKFENGTVVKVKVSPKPVKTVSNGQEKTKKPFKKATKIPKKPLKTKVYNVQKKTKKIVENSTAKPVEKVQPKEVAKKEIKKPIPQPRKRKPKVNKNKQIALFGAKKQPIKPKLNGVPVIEELEEKIIEKPVEKPVATNKLMQMKFDSLPINEEWSELMQNPASNLKIAIWGKPKNGKTSGSLQMAEYFTSFGNVLYNFADQGFNKSTQDLWIDSGLANNKNAFPDDSDTTEALEKVIATGNYKFVFIDMISDYIRKEKLRPEEFKERFIKRFPNVSFILIFEVTKSGDFKGDQGWTHLVDAIMTVENFLMENRGRYGMGERIIWEEGFKKFNPKRYAEFMENKGVDNSEEPKEEEIEKVPSTAPVEFSFQIN